MQTDDWIIILSFKHGNDGGTFWHGKLFMNFFEKKDVVQYESSVSAIVHDMRMEMWYF